MNKEQKARIISLANKINLVSSAILDNITEEVSKDTKSEDGGLTIKTSGDEALGFGNTKIQVGDEVETIDGEIGKVVKRYHDFAGQLFYRVALKHGEKSFPVVKYVY